MNSGETAAAVNPYTAADVEAILRERGWLGREVSAEQAAWCERAAAWLGGHVADRAGLEDLLGLVFRYDAGEILARVESHVVMSRYAARDVLRKLALMLLEGTELTPERFQEIVTVMKTEMELKGRELFHPIRLALAGRAGEGELDRVILLLDEAWRAGLGVKTARERIVEFCAGMD